jgi:hypothetical protein
LDTRKGERWPNRKSVQMTCVLMNVACFCVKGNLFSRLSVSLGRPPTKQIPCKREFVLSTFFTVRVGEMIQHQCFGVSAWCKVGACPGRIASATSAAKVIGSVSPEAVVLCLQLYST